MALGEKGEKGREKRGGMEKNKEESGKKKRKWEVKG
jgi:hypothetical protein